MFFSSSTKSDARTALDEARALAQHAEHLGYRCIWVAEHHNMPRVTTEAVPGAGTNVPLWILGSSPFGAQLAARLGLPYGFASHFAPQALYQALEIYHSTFRPSAQLDKPYALIGVNVIAAETDQEARYLATSQQMSFADLVRGARGLMQAPIDDIQTYWSPQDKAQAGQMLGCSVIGSRESVRRGLQKLIEDTAADELMIVCDVFDPHKRLKPLEIIADALKMA